MREGPEYGLAAGLTATVDMVVTGADTALALGSGDVPVLGTPRVVALAEAATVAAIAGSLEPGQTTVGVRIELDHRAATPVGRKVVARATLATVDRRRLSFDVVVTDGEVIAASGAVHRVVVDRLTFLEQV